MATRTIRAIYDGKVFRPIEPVELEPDTEVQILLEEGKSEAEGKKLSFIETALSLNLDGPEDWSENIDKYLYGNVGEDEE